MRLRCVLFLALVGVLLAPERGVPAPVAAHKQPLFTFKTKELQPGLPRGKGRWMVGYVEVFRKDYALPIDVRPDQVIKVVMNANYASFAQFGVERPDLNCDGFPDVAVLQHGGAKWGRAHVWQYDPNTSTFITTPLTREFAKLTFASYRIDAKARRLYLRKFHGAQIFEHIYRITPERLELESKKLVVRRASNSGIARSGGL